MSVTSHHFDAFVVGGGAAGSEVAFLLAKGGLGVGLAERDRLGGECNHYGCVPTKVMLRSARLAHEARRSTRFGVQGSSASVDLAAVQERARAVIEGFSGEGAAPFEREGIAVFEQEARIVGSRTVELADGRRLDCERIVIATGTRPETPPVPGLDEGPFWTNKEAVWGRETVPTSLGVIGTGAVGTEFAQIYARFGARVTMLEAADRFLPREDADAGRAVAAAFESEGIDIRAGVEIVRASHGDAGWALELPDGEVAVEELLVAAGRRPVFDGHDLDAAGVELDDAGRPVLGETLRTTQPTIWVIGDATGDLLFTHVADYEAGIAARDILGDPIPRDYRVVPRVTFCDPEIASVGITEQEGREAGLHIRTALVEADTNERSIIDGDPRGLVKVITSRESGEILGAHIVMPEAGAMIHEVVALMTTRAKLGDVSGAIHAYPTRSEALAEAFRQLTP
jgi:pyruvate/2-oxoglutarate dehydrogenase complex dihydrolipoamide dehydrogenase (E3) component